MPSETRSSQRNYRPETRLVQSGILRSQFGETSEAMFLTQGYVYDNSAQAEARFKGEIPGLSSIRALRTRPCACLRPAWRISKAPKTVAPPRPEWLR